MKRLSDEEKKFFKNVRQGNMHLIGKMLIQSPNLIKTRNNNEYTAMHCAAEKGQITVLELLIQKDPDLLRATDKFGNTPLAVATNVDTQNYLKAELSKLTQVLSMNPDINNNSHNHIIQSSRASINSSPAVNIIKEHPDLATLQKENKDQAQLIDQLKLEIIELKAQLKFAKQLIGGKLDNTQAKTQAEKSVTNTTTPSTSVYSAPYNEVNNNNENRPLPNNMNVKKETTIFDSQAENIQIEPLEFMATIASIKPEPDELTFVEREQNKRNAAAFEVSNNKRQRG